MKRLFLALALCLAVAATSLAATVNLTWDAKPSADTRVAVRIYERFGTAAPYTYTQIGTVSEPTNTFIVPAVTVGTHTYVVTGVNSSGESAYSNAVSAVILAIPGVVTNVTITITP
jgi:hypothetical protein